MARAQDPNSAGSQFFICVADAPFLDGKYSVFGEVVSGMEIADKIVSQPRDKKDNPNDRIEMKVKVVELQ
jgi:peptidyl-prolyl cis-trans isomerase B (cyclophilin B)